MDGRLVASAVFKTVVPSLCVERWVRFPHVPANLPFLQRPFLAGSWDDTHITWLKTNPLSFPAVPFSPTLCILFCRSLLLFTLYFLRFIPAAHEGLMDEIAPADLVAGLVTGVELRG